MLPHKADVLLYPTVKGNCFNMTLAVSWNGKKNIVISQRILKRSIQTVYIVQLESVSQVVTSDLETALKKYNEL